MPLRFAAVLLGWLVLFVEPLAAQDDLFPFVVSYDAPRNATNVSAWLEKPAGKHGFVRAEGGRLVTDAGPIRFWATNLCFDACFPEREQAERVAARLARFGINCVRMHHMDSHSIWGKSPNKTIIDPERLDRLDWLIYQLKQHGIYTNINLHVSRWLDDKEGFPHRDQRPNYDKGLDNFEPRMIELQKKYARDLLTHVNPYTKTAYRDEPAIAFVEINNENALWATWGWGQLDQLPDPYATTFRKAWNAWLRTKYGSTDKLRQAWNAQAVPLGQEMLRNGDFAQAPEPAWNLERDAKTEVSWSVERGGPDGGRLLRVVVKRQGEVAWHPQITQGGFAVKKNHPYTLSFRARADQKRQIALNCMMAHEPWNQLGFATNVRLTPQWQRYRFTFLADRDDPKARISLSGLSPGTYEFTAFSLRPGGIVGVEPDQKLEDDSVPVLRKGEMNLTEPARHDFADFLSDTEAAYWGGMYRFLKEELKVRPLVSGTQMGYSPPHIQARLDYIDAHAYWHHPVFPNRPWDSREWYVVNEALVNAPAGTLGHLAATRVAGMAYTVSEYNHPAPNVYAAEGFPMIAAVGAFQSWDGIFSFTYSHSTDFEPRKIQGYFDIKSDTAKLVHMPACAAMFLRGDVSPAEKSLHAPLSADQERRRLREGLSAWNLNAGQLGLDPRWALIHRIALDLQASESPTPKQPVPKLSDPTTFVSDTGQLRWDVSQKGAGYFVADTPRCKLLTGFVRDRTVELGTVKLRIGKTRLDWATISLVALDGNGFDQPGRILIAATGWMQNTGAKLEELGRNRITLRNRWGDEPILCEGVRAWILLPADPARVTFYPLDESGNRRPAAAVQARAGQTVLEFGPQHKTVWYEVEIR